MKHLFLKLFMLFYVSCFGVGAIADGQNWKDARFVRESVEIGDHYVFNTPIKVNGATILIRDFRNQVVNASVSSMALEPYEAYSIWWAVFNYPRFCDQPFRCSVQDLEVNKGDPRVRASVFWAGGLVADANGAANASLQLLPGRTQRETFAKSRNLGLLNLRGAELHLVLRSHGPAGEAGPLSAQVGSANKACPAGDPKECKNVFASFHPPR